MLKLNVKMMSFSLTSCNLNTSHVKVKLSRIEKRRIWLSDLNTSHVKVKLSNFGVELEVILFKYISC